ncbi:group 3 secretory phospholipase A2-like [Solea senegalensis]|uniref:phospholipase A2 n=1 Tax=Solea senegalensis TaxID=28829 RepID=A0AAV6QEU6_SOLSE|nr:group 3 secretory phospholipase A2-like [Solea senegalensis]KAG7489573.1 group 3 secretory phospholipase A2-like [Solea senegalensis]
MCEVIGSDSALLGVTSGPLREGRARVKGHAAEAKARRKRSWIVPGTLWCGVSSKASTYEELGMFENTDRCCREHDHCLHVIPSFTVNYGVFNSHFYTLSHCDCDQRFRQCLLGANDTVSSMVGYSFFNILRVPCFELKQKMQCTRMHWWGMCKVSKEAPYAVLRTPLPYNTSNATSKYGEDDDGSEETRAVIGSPRKPPKNKHRCRSRDPPRGDTFYPRASGKGCKKLSSQKPQTSRTNTTTAPMTTRLFVVALTPRDKRVERKRSDRKDQAPPHVSTATQSILSSTTTKTTTNNHKQPPKQSRCCESRTPCKNSLGQETTTVPTATHGPSVRVTTLWTTQIKTKQERRKTLWNTDAFTKARPKTTSTLHEDRKPQQQMDSGPRGNDTRQTLQGRTTAQSDHVRKRLKQNNDTIPDYQLLCGSLKHLDECRFQIRPLEKKYDLQNEESKTVYHCDCTTRLAASVRRFKRPSVVPALLADFVSQRCFKVPKKKKCQRRKRCSGGFSKASDLLRALKKTEEQHSGHDARKRAIPVRLYKRCLKLEREAETAVAQQKHDYYR